MAPLHLAAKLGRFDAMKALLELEADLSACTVDGNTPLHLAIGYNNFDCAVKLKHSGADEKLRNLSGFTAATGFDGTGSFGVAALYSAKSPKQVEIAFKVCDQNIAGRLCYAQLDEAWLISAVDVDVNLTRFVDGVAMLRKSLAFKGWGPEHEQRYQMILAKLKAKETITTSEMPFTIVFEETASSPSSSKSNKLSITNQILCGVEELTRMVGSSILTT
jgi:hypothetical protein